MSNDTQSLPVSSYAMEYGTILGISWATVFAIYVTAIRTSNSLLFIIGLAGFVLNGIVPFLLAHRLKQWLPSGERINIWAAIHFSMSMFMYACLLSTAVAYVYFEFMDKGEVLRSLQQMLANKETEEMYRQMEMYHTYKVMNDLLHQFSLTSAVDKTLMIFNNGFTWSLFLMAPVTVAAHRKSK